MRVLRTYRCTICDGPGLRYAIYLAGCRHACPGCHNPLSWNPNQGAELTPQLLQSILQEISSDPMLDGITISGGDPYYDPAGLLQLLQQLKANSPLPIWVYTGYTLQELLEAEPLAATLPYIHTLVDGRFVQALANPCLQWRGSSNQRIIPIAEQIANGTLSSPYFQPLSRE